MHISGFLSLSFRFCIRFSVSALFMHRTIFFLPYIMYRLLFSLPLHPLFSVPILSDLLFQYNLCTALLFLFFMEYANFCLFYVLHLRFIYSCVISCFFFYVSAKLYLFRYCISASSFIYQPGFNHLYTVFCFSLYISATKLKASPSAKSRPGSQISYILQGAKGTLNFTIGL